MAPLTSPGHQAGAPLRRGSVDPRPHRQHSFPRPSGRGSIAATRPRLRGAHEEDFPRPSGRGSIAAPRGRRTAAGCGTFPRPSGRGSIAARCRAERPTHRRGLPPAIRPGLHCGTLPGRATNAQTGTSPGHQAGAPLRHVARRVLCDLAPSSPGHQAGAPLRPDPADLLALPHDDFPRPSGRGSIAALSSTARCCAPWALPPAIRPGLHCGTACL